MTTITLGGSAVRTIPQHTVYTREHWYDAWTERPNLHCLEATWSVAPSIPTAVLVWRYGETQPQGDQGFSSAAKRDITRHYVRVDFTNDDGGTRSWYGVAAQESDETGGTSPLFGSQTIPCYGVEQLLAMHLVDSSFFRNGTVARETSLPIAFNARGKPNRSIALFGGAHIFEPDAALAQWWSTRNIVEYLLRRMVPHDNLGNPVIAWKMLHVDRLQDDDRPQLETDGATTYSLLARLIDRRRLRTWHATVNESETPDRVELIPSTLTASGVTFEAGFGNIPANNSTHKIVLHEDGHSSATVRTDALEKVDQVIARGARMRSVGTFSFQDGNLIAGWYSQLEIAYAVGASGEAGYAALDDDGKRKWNADVRNGPTLEHVYSLFRIPADWDFKAGNGTGGAQTGLFLDALGDIDQQFLQEMFVEPSMPLLEGVDYSGSVISNDAVDLDPSTGEELRPLVAFLRPDSARWVLGDRIGAANSESDEDTEITGENNRWSAHVGVIPESQQIRIVVQGEAQHVIAATDFTPLAVDMDLGGYDYKGGGMIVTLSLIDNRRLEARYPQLEPAGFDAIRHREVLAGDSYRRDYVAPNTVVGVDADGSLLTSDGGYVRDDLEALRVVARTAAEWYTQEHAILHLRTQRHPAEPQPGDIITTIDEGTSHERTINAPVTLIRIESPLSGADSPQAPEMEIVTWAGELDEVGIVPHRPRQP